jgi:lysophospholipase L1-like esterase
MRMPRLMAAVCLVGIGTCGIGSLDSQSARALSSPVFTSKCVGQPIPYPISRRPIITFGDSITEGYGATNKCLPRELRAVLPKSAHRVYTGDTSYPGDLVRLEHRMVLNYGVGGELTSDGLPRLRSILRSVHPSIVFILEGINDLWGGRSTADIVDNFVRHAAYAAEESLREAHGTTGGCGGNRLPRPTFRQTTSCRALRREGRRRSAR